MKEIKESLSHLKELKLTGESQLLGFSLKKNKIKSNNVPNPCEYLLTFPPRSPKKIEPLGANSAVFTWLSLRFRVRDRSDTRFSFKLITFLFIYFCNNSSCRQHQHTWKPSLI